MSGGTNLDSIFGKVVGDRQLAVRNLACYGVLIKSLCFYLKSCDDLNSRVLKRSGLN
jgi:hypothetical protein